MLALGINQYCPRRFLKQPNFLLAQVRLAAAKIVIFAVNVHTIFFPFLSTTCPPTLLTPPAIMELEIKTFWPECSFKALAAR